MTTNEQKREDRGRDRDGQKEKSGSLGQMVLMRYFPAFVFIPYAGGLGIQGGHGSCTPLTGSSLYVPT